MKIILASQSVARRKALEILGLEYEVIPSNFDESSIKEDNPHERARKLAEAKARTVGEKHNAIIVAADLFVVLDHKNYEKPKDNQEAIQMLKDQSGRQDAIYI